MSMMPTLLRMNKVIPEMLDYLPLPVKIRQALKKGMTALAQRELELQKQGISGGGRGKPVSQEEKQAKLGKIAADTQVQLARAAHMQTKKLRDEINLVLDALVQGHKAKMDRDQLGSDLAEKALLMLQSAKEITTVDVPKRISE